MMDTSLPVAILVAALALMLGFTSRSTAARGVTIAVSAALANSWIKIPLTFSTALVTICCLGTIVFVLFIYWPGRLSRTIALVFSAIAGVITGLGTGLMLLPQSLFPVMAAGALVLPSLLLVERGYAIAIRVVASWLVAIAVLAALLPYLVVHPGYVQEHRQ